MGEKVLFNAILLILTGVVLLYASWFDIRNKLIQPQIIVFVMILGLLYYFLSSGTLAFLISNFFILTFIFLIPAIFGMGWGDMYLIWSLGLFFGQEGDANVFLAGFIVSAIIWTVFWVDRYGLWFRKKDLITFEYPFVPPIAVGFIVWGIYSFL
jgi:Flp pilus assembly protein protease CpaA